MESVSSAPAGGLLRGWRAASAETGKSRVQLWRDIRAGRFPAPIELGPNSVGWYRAEIDAWLAARPRRTYRAESA
jgi:prophage regulatory protein